MDENKSLTVPNPQDDPEWKEIVEQIVSELERDGQLPDKAVEATELLIAGWPTYKIAKRLQVRTQDVRRWLEIYPSMATAVAKGRKLMTAWRMARLEQQYVQAIEKSEEILDLDLEDRGVNSKLVGVVAQHARFIISLFAGQKIDVNVKLEEGEETLKAKKSALNYLAEQLAAQRDSGEVVEATYKVVPAQPEESKPMLLANGNPAYGELGGLSTNEEGTLCHICGERFSKLGFHVISAHHLKLKIYEMVYMLPPGSLKESGEANNDGTESG